MAVKLAHQSTSNNVMVLVGYEGGLTAAFRLPRNISDSVLELAELVYLSKPHSQPVLSLDNSPDGQTYFTSSADAIIAAHIVPDQPWNNDESDHGLQVAKELPSPAMNGDVPDIGPSSLSRELSTEVAEPNPQESTGPTSNLNFAKQPVSASNGKDSTTSTKPSPGGLSSLLSSAPPQPLANPIPPPQTPVVLQPPHKLTDTKHAGQQSLHIRSDARLLATGGWDTKIRIYSTKTLKEVAVLKWHKEGVYAVAFSEILQPDDIGTQSVGGSEVAVRETGLGRLQRQREEAMQLRHWLVAGAKDGKVSLWEVF